jgi:phage portal protein BeeE
MLWSVLDRVANGCCRLQGSGNDRAAHYRWRKEYGGMGVDQAKKLKQLEPENGRLKKLAADLSLEKQV